MTDDAASLPMKISVYLMHFPVRTLGPGTRIGIWFQGCRRRCPGCVTPESWNFAPEDAVSLDEVLGYLKKYTQEMDGLTVSGGEPFDQPEALLELLRRVKSMGMADVLVYSGFRADELTERHPEFWAEGLIDALVDGPFELGNPTDSTWKGSENQTFTLWNESLAPRYALWTRETARRLQWVRDLKTGARRLVGIPRQEDAPRLTGGTLWTENISSRS